MRLSTFSDSPLTSHCSTGILNAIWVGECWPQSLNLHDRGEWILLGIISIGNIKMVNILSTAPHLLRTTRGRCIPATTRLITYSVQRDRRTRRCQNSAEDQWPHRAPSGTTFCREFARGQVSWNRRLDLFFFLDIIGFETPCVNSFPI